MVKIKNVRYLYLFFSSLKCAENSGILVLFFTKNEKYRLTFLYICMCVMLSAPLNRVPHWLILFLFLFLFLSLSILLWVHTMSQTSV